MNCFAPFLLLSSLLFQIEGHGRMTDPIQRGSLWRDPQWGWANPEKPQNDEEFWCGGRPVTDSQNGACGLCGDSVLDSKPRNAEIGGIWDKGIIVQNYTKGATIPVSIFVSISHLGYWQFRICDYSKNGEETEDCFHQYPLQFVDGTTRYSNADSSSRMVHHELKLPNDVTCNRCVLQWDWIAEATSQIYRNCADISIQ